MKILRFVNLPGCLRILESEQPLIGPSRFAHRVPEPKAIKKYAFSDVIKAKA